MIQLAAAYIYRHVLKIDGVTNETWFNEYFITNRNAGVLEADFAPSYRTDVCNKTVTNIDGSVIVSSNYNAINCSYVEVLNVYTLVTLAFRGRDILGTDYFGS